MTAIGLMGIAMSNSLQSDGSQPNPPETRCTADGGKAFSPELTPDQICAHFGQALGSQSDSIRAELHFSMRGMASVRITRLRDGQWQDMPTFELAVMDRHFGLSDIERLAQDVLDGIGGTTETQGE